MQTKNTAEVSLSQAAKWLQSDIVDAWKLFLALNAEAARIEGALWETSSYGRYEVLLDQKAALLNRAAELNAQIEWAVAHPNEAIAYYL